MKKIIFIVLVLFLAGCTKHVEPMATTAVSEQVVYEDLKDRARAYLNDTDRQAKFLSEFSTDTYKVKEYDLTGVLRTLSFKTTNLLRTADLAYGELEDTEELLFSIETKLDDELIIEVYDQKDILIKYEDELMHLKAKDEAFSDLIYTYVFTKHEYNGPSQISEADADAKVADLDISEVFSLSDLKGKITDAILIYDSSMLFGTDGSEIKIKDVDLKTRIIDMISSMDLERYEGESLMDLLSVKGSGGPPTYIAELYLSDGSMIRLHDIKATGIEVELVGTDSVAYYKGKYVGDNDLIHSLIDDLLHEHRLGNEDITPISFKDEDIQIKTIQYLDGFGPLISDPEKRGLKAYEDEKILEEYRRSDRPQLFIDTAGNIFEATYN